MLPDMGPAEQRLWATSHFENLRCAEEKEKETTTSTPSQRKAASIARRGTLQQRSSISEREFVAGLLDWRQYTAQERRLLPVSLRKLALCRCALAQQSSAADCELDLLWSCSTLRTQTESCVQQQL